jgi:hypothetical protein
MRRQAVTDAPRYRDLVKNKGRGHPMIYGLFGVDEILRWHHPDLGGLE